MVTPPSIQFGIDLLTLKEVAQFCRVGEATVKYWASMLKIKTVKLGKHPLVRRDELLRFIRSAEVGGPDRNSRNIQHI